MISSRRTRKVSKLPGVEPMLEAEVEIVVKGSKQLAKQITTTTTTTKPQTVSRM